MKLLSKTSHHFIITLFCFFLFTYSVYGQQEPTVIELASDTSGYLDFSEDGLGKGVEPPAEVVPTIKGEMNVSEQGTLTYNIPIEVFKGINDFQPNLALAYNSQSGNGQAGIGWNLVGLSSITVGGKSNRIDDSNEGVQYNDSDPYYLDGQRLIKVVGSSNQYVTEQHTQIKITKVDENNFKVQYTDGKVAKYNKKALGQFLLTDIQDAFGNKIFYTYTVITGVPYISTIKYGGSSDASSLFSISFSYLDRQIPLKIYRNGELMNSSKFLNEIQVASTGLGLHRKYILTHDLTSTKLERLRKVEIENKLGAKLKPLVFNYNLENGTIEASLKNDWSKGYPQGTKKLGSTVYGDFVGNGEISASFIVKNDTYHLINSKLGSLPLSDIQIDSTDLFSGRILDSNNKLTSHDILTIFKDSNTNEGYTLLNNKYVYNKLITVKFLDILTGESKNSKINIPTGYHVIDIPNGGTHIKLATPKYLSGDFNNDGLMDLLILIKPSKGTTTPYNPVGEYNDNSVPPTFDIGSTAYLYELGKYSNSSIILPSKILSNSPFNGGGNIQIIEFNGDNIPELAFLLGNNASTYRIEIHKLNLLQNKFELLKSKPLPYRSKQIWGDFNGDGLSDFMVPETIIEVGDIPLLTVEQAANKIKNGPHIWRVYTNTGLDFSYQLKDFSSQKLAFCRPSQRDVVERASEWEEFWTGIALDDYQETKYAACGVIPIDYNNDGRTDLVSFSKFGRIIVEEVINDSRNSVQNLSFSGNNDINKIVLHENIADNDGGFSLQSFPENQFSISNQRISPYSLVINSYENRGIEDFRSNFKIFDPLLNNQTVLEINSSDFLENHLKEIDNGSGVKQTIEYTPASIIVKNGNDVTWHLYYKYKPEEADLNYPYFINKHQPNYLLVKRINTIFDDTAISKEYRYQNAMQKFDGKGFMGFQKTKVSDPYESKLMNGEYLPKNPFEGVMWTINTYDPASENVLVKTEYGSLDGEDILTSTETEYERKEKPNKQYTYVSTIVTAKDFLKDITITKTYTYRTDDWLLQNVVTNFNGEASSTSTFGYKPSFTSGDHFFYGKIILNQQSTTKGGQTFTTKDEYDFFTTNGATKLHRKFGNGTTALLTEFTYFSNGNLQTEKISGSGITALTTTFAYETTNRYVNKITAPDGLISQSVVNALGEVQSETSPLGLVTEYQYDGWGNKIKVTDFLGLETNLIKTPLTNGQYSLSTQKAGSPTTIVTFDRFDRPVKTRTQSINNKWLVSDIVYDIYGKKIKESEPYFQDSPNILWNEFEYDALDRVIEQKFYTGKIITTCYEGMTVTVEDGDQKTSKTLDAMGNVIKHVDMGGQILYDYYPNGTLKEADYDGVTISVSQDGWGNKTRLEDPSAGTYTYTYDILGRQLTEVTPKGQTTYTYDSFGKLLTETSTGDETNITSTYEYYPLTNLPKKITGSNGTNSFIYETFYDQDTFQIIGKKETLTGAFIYETILDYDPYGRLETTELKTTVNINNQNKTTTSKIENIYESGSGIIIEQKDFTANRRIWKIDEVNQKGQTKKMIYGNNFILTNEYDNYFLPTKIKDQNNLTNQTALEIDYVFDPQKRRLNSRDILVFSKNEKFVYDQLDRLTQEKVNNVVVNEYTYDVRGRMTYNKDVGTYEYNESDYQIEKFKFNSQGQNLMNNRGIHQLKFNAFKQVTEIYLPGHDRISYGFNLFKKRAIAYYGNEAPNTGLRPIRKYYTSDNAVEIVFNSTTNKTDITTYLDGDPYSSSYIKVDKFTGTTLNSSTNYYLHRDYQGTILALSNTLGRVVEQRYFDAWGNIKQVKHTAWNGSIPTFTFNTTLGIIDRGYTGHEHLQSVGLIHMNGRLYDPVIRRFLSPDNFVQDPYNTQNFDRYSYVYNNPLCYTDPSGEEITMMTFAIVAVVAVLSNGINNMINGEAFFKGALRATMTSVGMAIISFGIGSAATSVTSSVIGQAAFQAGAHGISGGIFSSMEGSGFKSGFAAGAISSLVSSVVHITGISGGQPNKFGQSDWFKATTLVAGGLSGGISSTIAGGNFWAGARQGLITSGLNHMAHGMTKSSSQIKIEESSEETEIVNPDGSQKMGAKAARILGSFIAYDTDKTFMGKALQIVSHFTWELPQQIISVIVAQFTNAIGGIESVYRYSNGSYLLNNRFMMSDVGFTMGNLMTVGPNSSMETIQHEFGHYIQSRRFGPLWFFVFGIPSITNAMISGGANSLQEYENSFYTEWNAGTLGRKYW